MIAHTFTNPLSKIGDVIRCSVIAERPQQIPHLFRFIAERVTALGGKFYIKNFWDDPKPLSLGYVGVHIKIRLPIPQEKTKAAISMPPSRKYILSEVQLHVKAIMDGTEDCAKEIAHRLYKAPREAGGETISPEIISSSQLVYLTAMARLLSSKEVLESVDGIVRLMQAMTKADKKMRLVMATAMLLHDEKLGPAEWNERLQVIMPKDGDAVAVAWMETAHKINQMIQLPAVIMDERDDWTNTATTVPEIYADAAEIAPLFSSMCRQAAENQPGCTVNFGPDNSYMLKKQDSLLDKLQADREEELGRFMLTLLQKIGRSWAQITENDAMPFGRFSQLQSLNFSDCNVIDSDLRFLEHLRALQTFSLSGCYQITDLGLVHLERLTSLRSLNLSGCGITDRGLGHLWRLTGLQRLNLIGCNEITSDGMVRAGLQSLYLPRQGPHLALNPESSLSLGVTTISPSTKDAYLLLLLQLLENPSVMTESSLVEILEREAQELVDQVTDLTPKQTKSYQLVQKLLIDQKISQFIAKNLSNLHPQEESKRPPVAVHIQSSSPHEGKSPPLAEEPPVSLQTPGSVSQEWITPEEQLKRLRVDTLEKDLAQAVTLWYTALTRLAQICPRVLPQKIPPLPADICQILDSRCSIYWDYTKPDGTPYKIKDTHILALVPEEFGTLQWLKEVVLTPYEKAHYRKATPFRLTFASDFTNLETECCKIVFERSHWVLMSKDAVPEDNAFPWELQKVEINNLKNAANIPYELPTLQQSITVIVTYKAATGQNLYQGGSDRRDYTLIRLREVDCALAIQYSGSSGVQVSTPNGGHGRKYVSYAILWKL